MKTIIEPGNVSGSLCAPASKSHTQRAYAAALLHKGRTIIHNAGHSADEEAALRVIAQLEAKITGLPDSLEILGNGLPFDGDLILKEINCGESGLCARLFTPIAGLLAGQVTITGTGSLLKRPMEGFAEVMPQLGLSLSGFSGYLPFTMQGPLKAGSFKMDGSGGSQLLSGLLFALCAAAKEPITITVSGLKSKPYIDMTLDVLAQFGKPVSHNNYKEFYIDPALFIHHETIEVGIEADWSSAANFLVAGAIAGEVTIENLNTSSKQADRAIMDVLRMANADIQLKNGQVTVKKALLNAFDFDATHCPDLFPALAILAACGNGESSIAGIHRLFYKESNRVESITEMLQDFGVPFSAEEDTLFITGMPFLQGTLIDSYNDHRIVMAAAVGALRANGRVDINNSESVSKSYPGFFGDFNKLRPFS